MKIFLEYDAGMAVSKYLDVPYGSIIFLEFSHLSDDHIAVHALRYGWFSCKSFAGLDGNVYMRVSKFHQ